MKRIDDPHKRFTADQLYEAHPDRMGDSRFYADRRWRRLRKRVIRLFPICQVCKKDLSKDVHHLKPRKDFPQLAFEESNLLCCCKACHTKLEKKQI